MSSFMKVKGAVKAGFPVTNRSISAVRCQKLSAKTMTNVVAFLTSKRKAILDF